MAWVTLGDALEAALVSMMDDGDEVAGTRLDASTVQRTADAETPAQFQQEVSQQTKEPGTSKHDFASRTHMDAALPTSRWEYAAMTRDAPSPAAYCHLVVDNGGGGRRQGEGRTSAAYARAGGGSHASNLVLIEGGRRHWTASAF